MWWHFDQLNLAFVYNFAYKKSRFIFRLKFGSNLSTFLGWWRHLCDIQSDDDEYTCIWLQIMFRLNYTVRVVFWEHTISSLFFLSMQIMFWGGTLWLWNLFSSREAVIALIWVRCLRRCSGEKLVADSSRRVFGMRCETARIDLGAVSPVVVWREARGWQ
jgi:hypothetical protein